MSTSIPCRLYSEVYHILLNAASPTRCSQTEQGHYTLITWPSDASLLPVRNAQCLLLPHIKDLLGHADSMSSCGVHLLCKSFGFTLRDTVSGIEIQLSVGQGNAGLVITPGSRCDLLRYSPVCLLMSPVSSKLPSYFVMKVVPHMFRRVQPVGPRCLILRWICEQVCIATFSNMNITSFSCNSMTAIQRKGRANDQRQACIGCPAHAPPDCI